MALPTSQHNVTVRKLSSTLNSYNTKVNTKLYDKADRVLGATNGNFAGLNLLGNLTDSGKKASDFATSAQGTKADSAIQSVKVEGTALTPDTNKAVNVTKTSLGLNNVTNDAQVKRTEMGAANGVATLDANGKIPTSQIPGSYDDVKEGYLYNGKFYTDAQHTTEIPAAGDKVYVDIPTNKTYRWSGTQYVVIGTDLALGETSSTAYRGDRGKSAYDHSQLTSGNPHNVSKNDVGLGNVDNKSAATLKSEFTGSVTDGNTGFTTGDAVYDAIAANGKGVEYVTTSDTATTVKDIMNDGKLPVLRYSLSGATLYLPLSENLGDPVDQGVYFSGVYSGTLYTIFLNGSSGWGTMSSVVVENTANKVTSWTSTTTDTNYPSEKLVKNSLDAKVDKETGKGLSTEDYTNDEKTKLGGISTGATKTESSSTNGKIKIDGTDTTVYTHPTTAGNKHIPSGGSSGQFLGYDSAGTAKWVANPNTDTSVTSVDNHYAPTEDAQAEKDASGGSATQLPTASSGTLVQVVTGVKMDSKGHVTGVVSAGLWSPDNNTTYTNVKLGSGSASAALGTSAAFTASLSNYTLNGGNGGTVAIKFSSDVPVNATLNVNSTGAKAIYYKGAAITAGVIQSGDTAFLMYNGAQYVLLGVDRSIEEMTDTEVTNLVDALT